LITGGSEFQKSEVVNLVIQGVTFAAGLGASVLLVSAGDVTFVDCIFRVSPRCDFYQHIFKNDLKSLFLQDHRNVGVVSLLFVVETRRHLHERETRHEKFSQLYRKLKHKSNKFIDKWDDCAEDSRSNRHLEDVPTTINRQNVAFRYCIFKNNSYGDQTIESETNDGVILSESPDNDLSFEGCIFEDNVFGDSFVSVSSSRCYSIVLLMRNGHG
jgi:hypothetical protein